MTGHALAAAAASLLAFLSVLLIAWAGAEPLQRVVGAIRQQYRARSRESEQAAGLLADLVPLLRGVASLRDDGKPRDRDRKIAEILAQAGAPNEIGPNEVWAASVLSAILGLVIGIALFKGLFSTSAFLGLPVAVFGFYLPGLWLRSYAGDRLKDMQRQLPYMIDLLVMSMEAGASFVEGIEIYIRDNSEQALATEWRRFLSEIQFGRTRREALTDLADRIGTPDVRRLALTVIHGEEMGTPLGALLRMYADGSRLERTQRAEKAAGEAAVRILGPSMLMMAAVILLILGPILIRYIRGGVMS